MAMLSVEEAQALVLEGDDTTTIEELPLLAAHRRVLAEDIAAKLTHPPFTASAMDGYAVRSSDVARLPACLSVIGESRAGRRFDGTLGAGEAVRIFTGATIPEGADTIVMQENVSREGGAVLVREGAAPRTHFRDLGTDFRAGDVLLRAGRVLEPRALALAAAMGYATLPVRKKPPVAILATGSELVEPGVLPGTDQIVASNSIGLAAMVERAGGLPVLLGIATDEPADLDAQLTREKRADILVTSGGASVGDHDRVVPALERAGFAITFQKIALRPGKPAFFGRLGARRVLGLPGNPVSALVCAQLFLVPLIRRLLGISPHLQERSIAVLDHDIGQNGARAHYMRGVRAMIDGEPHVHVLDLQDSSFLAPFARADCLIVRAPGAPAVFRGSRVPVLPIDFD